MMAPGGLSVHWSCNRRCAFGGGGTVEAARVARCLPIVPRVRVGQCVEFESSAIPTERSVVSGSAPGCILREHPEWAAARGACR